MKISIDRSTGHGVEFYASVGSEVIVENTEDGLILKSDDGQRLQVTTTDNGFELRVIDIENDPRGDKYYEIKGGLVTLITKQTV